MVKRISAPVKTKDAGKRHAASRAEAETSAHKNGVRDEVRRIAEKGIKKHEETWKELAKH